LLGSILLLAVAIICIYLFYRQPKQDQEVENEVETPETPKTPDPKEAANEELMQRIHHLVVEEKQFLNSDLTASGLANELGTHRNNISACVNLIKGCNFTQYVNGYRIEYAKQLMLKYPDQKANAIGIDSGFANDTSFFRTFRALTGQTPGDWKRQQSSQTKTEE
jgi:YesN/AraC family two-component response regulator